MIRGKDRFGINMTGFCKEHERYMRDQIDSCKDLKELLSYHNKKLEWLQHERQIHLSVTLFTVMIFILLNCIEFFINDSLPVLALLAIALIMMSAYLLHYFKLENTVQHWYMISDEIYRKLHKK